MLGIMAVQIIHPPFGQIVFGGVVFLAGSGKLFALAQKAAQNGVGKRAVLAFADFGDALYRFVNHGVRCVAGVVQLIHGRQ